MSTRAAVSFIAISNHVLDAAKSNRCVCLLRAEPDNDELRSIANGCILDRYDDSKRATLVAGLPPSLEVMRFLARMEYSPLIRSHRQYHPR